MIVRRCYIYVACTLLLTLVIYALFYSGITNQVTVLPLAELRGEEAINDLSGPDPEGSLHSPDQQCSGGSRIFKRGIPLFLCKIPNTYDGGGPCLRRVAWLAARRQDYHLQ